MQASAPPSAATPGGSNKYVPCRRFVSQRREKGYGAYCERMRETVHPPARRVPREPLWRGDVEFPWSIELMHAATTPAIIIKNIPSCAKMSTKRYEPVAISELASPAERYHSWANKQTTAIKQTGMDAIKSPRTSRTEQKLPMIEFNRKAQTKLL